MPKIKKARVPVRIDMTPMVDVAFLLLTFFMLTTQFKPPAEVEIILPTSHSQFKLPETDVMTVTISKDSRIFLGFDSQILTGRIFGDQNKLRPNMEVTLKELPDMLVRARVSNPKLRTVIKGDQDAEYGVTEDILDILQKTKITRFNLVTDMKRD
jgi:biopolymer transport protein ExbD